MRWAFRVSLCGCSRVRRKQAHHLLRRGDGCPRHHPFWAEMPTVVAPAPWAGAPQTSAATLALRHSRSAPRPLQPRTVRGGERNWPGVGLDGE